MSIFSSWRPNPRVLRLGLTYLVIIVILCLGFSAVFYATSSSSLDLNLTSSNEAPKEQGTATKSLTLKAEGREINEVSPASPTDVDQLNRQLYQQVQSVRQELLKRLVLFNVGALFVGAFISYFLARRTLQSMEAVMEMQARFLSDASHELRTPLTALKARNEVALRNPHLTLTEAKDIIRSSIQQTQKLEELTEGLLHLSREDPVITRQAVSLEEAANEAMNDAIVRAQAKHIAIEEIVPCTYVQAHQQSIVQAVLILLDNAIKYSNPHSTVYLEGGTDGKFGFLSVRDTGSGMSASDIPHIFDRFYQADSSRTREGYGLGLAIAKKLIQQNKGTITVQSSIGKGTTFTIRLPIG